MTWMCKKMSWKLKFGVHYHVVVLDLAREAVFLPGDQTPEGLLGHSHAMLAIDGESSNNLEQPEELGREVIVADLELTEGP